MDWYIFIKRPLSFSERFSIVVGNKADTVGRKIGLLKNDVFSSESFGIGSSGYDETPDLIIKSSKEFLDENSITSYLEELNQSKRAFCVKAVSVKDAIRIAYINGFLLDGEQRFLNDRFVVFGSPLKIAPS